MSAIDTLLQDRHGGVETSPLPQHLRTTVLTCMDTRINPDEIFGSVGPPAKLLRNAGGVLTPEVLDVIHQADTTAILVLQHNRCGMEGLQESELVAKAMTLRKVRVPSLQHLPFDLRAFAQDKSSVSKALRTLRAHPTAARITIRGGVFDVDSGAIAEVDRRGHYRASNIDALLRGNAVYAAQHRADLPGRSAIPAQGLVLVTVGEIDPYQALQLKAGQAHVITSTTGGFTEDVRRSLAVSQIELGTREVFFVGRNRAGRQTEIATALSAARHDPVFDFGSVRGATLLTDGTLQEICGPTALQGRTL